MSDGELEGDGDLSVADVAEQRWGVRPPSAIERFDLPGWSYEGEVDVVCPRCHGALHTMRKPYESAGKTYRYVAIVCPACPASFTLPDLGLKTQADLLARGSRSARSSTSPPATAGTQRGDTSVPCSTSPGLQIRSVRANDVAARLLGTSRDRGRPQGVGPVRVHVVKPPVETRRLYWRKIATPATVLPSLPQDTDVRVLLPATPAFDELRERLASDGVGVRSVAHWVEEEIISTVDQDDDLRPLSVTVALTSAGGLHTEWGPRVVDQPAYDARDAFEAIWDAHIEVAEEPPHVPAAEVVPGEWLEYLPFDLLNPAQAQAAPAVLETAEHLVITAPTGRARRWWG